MNQCLRCNKPCTVPSMLCDECRAYLQTTVRKGEDNKAPSQDIQYAFPTSAIDNTTFEETPLQSQEIKSETQSKGYALYNNVGEQAVNRLNAAARYIADDPDLMPNAKVRRASRLSPLPDISAEIQRDNTPREGEAPLPRTNYSTEPGTRNALADKMPDLWPWMQELEIDEQEHDAWIAQSDPLISRQVPRSSGNYRDDELADLTRASTIPMAIARSPRWMRILIVSIISVLIFALVIDIGLIVSSKNKEPRVSANAIPALTLSNLEPKYGQRVLLNIRHFTPSAQVAISRDIGEKMTLENEQGSLVTLSESGTKDVPFIIEPHWDPGFHTIVVEDVTTRFTASVTLRVDAGPTRPAHLLIKQTQIDLGSNIQGANTLQPITLENSGSGIINWSASSDSSWLLVSPDHGHFSDQETIHIAGDRSKLKPGTYEGSITISSNVGAAQRIRVAIEVQSIPDDAGAVLSVSPALLAFSAVDGLSDPSDQILVISNPGKEDLHWEIENKQPKLSTDKTSYLTSNVPTTDWLSTVEKAGVLKPGKDSIIHVKVRSRHLLPDTYVSSLVLRTSKGHKALNSPQSVSVALTVQRRCGLGLSVSNMSFTAVAGKENPSNQSLNLSATTGCPSNVSWSATSSASWLTVSPAKGVLKGSVNAVTTIGVNISGLKPGTYVGHISLSNGENMYTVPVELTVQAPPPPAAPILSASPLNLNFSTIQGANDPPGQKVTIFNTGKSPLFWRTAINQLQSSTWLGTSPTGGQIAAGQTGTIEIKVSADELSASGSYVGEVVLSATDENNKTASGSPQVISVNFTVSPPCVLNKPSKSALSFSGIPGGVDPTPQPVVFSATGSCHWPVQWKTTVTGSAPWLKLSQAGGTFTASDDSSSITVDASIAGLSVGKYSTQVTLSANDADGAPIQGSPQTFNVELNVLPVCTLQSSSSAVSLTATQGLTSNVQNILLSSGANCNVPVSWEASVQSATSWMNLSPFSGTFTGEASIGLSANAATLLPGTYQTVVTFTPQNTDGVIVNGRPEITVTLIVKPPRYQILGTVYACADSSCDTPLVLAGATLTLRNGEGESVWTGTADANGQFVIPNLTEGTYTLSANGSNGGTVYAGSKSINVVNNVSNVMVTTTAIAATATATTPISTN